MSEDFTVHIGEIYECPFCHSHETELIKGSIDYIQKKVEKPQIQNTGMIKITQYYDNKKNYYIKKVLCLKCGQISKSLTKESLKQYNEDKDYFIN